LKSSTKLSYLEAKVGHERIAGLPLAAVQFSASHSCMREDPSASS
jgi:hypothetical protein